VARIIGRSQVLHPLDLVCSLEAEYRKLLELRERVAKAEAAALRLKPRVGRRTKTATKCAVLA
jgi:hypothetical protein